MTPYEWSIEGQTVRGHLTAEQAAAMRISGVDIAEVQGYRCTRAEERHWGEHTQAEIAEMTADGWTCEVGACWPSAPPALAVLQAARLDTYRQQAAAVIVANVPAPWDTLRDLATVEYAAWVDAFRAAVAAELSRLETAVEAAGDAAALNAIVADWPEVEA